MAGGVYIVGRTERSNPGHRPGKRPMPVPDHSRPATSADPEELRRFADLAAEWWDETGPMAALHQLNPTRLAYLRDRVCARFDRDPLDERPLAGLDVLDVGCGGGLLSEPLARLGAAVTGIDLETANLAVARRHAETRGLSIHYREISPERLAAEGATFKLVCVMEVVEHVADPARFLNACGRLVGPGGALVLATFNRTIKSFALGVVAAEYILGWLPRGTHRWSRFVRPSEAARALRRNGLTIVELTGVSYDPLRDRFRLSPDPAVNYMLFAIRD
jgi:2-polyprenyl-6-hydroxyphenyl methylase/3-demethylubiquinone-9 3-methyltransferase